MAQKLGSLTQAARSKDLKQARWLLIFVGIVNLGAGLFFFAQAADEVRTALNTEIRKAGPGVVVDQAKLQEVEKHTLFIVRVMYGGVAFLGVIFIVLGCIIQTIPVVATALSLGLYIAANIVFAVLNPMSLVTGLIFKVVIVVVLVKALMAAIAYQREASRAYETVAEEEVRGEE
jgi:hypothetical protein